MKNQRTVGILLILVIISLLGVGYAMKTKDLKIEGTAKATADDNNFIVRFKEGVEPTVTGGAVATRKDDITATISVEGLTKVGDTATATYKIENKSKAIDANITAVVTNDNETFFEVTTSIDGNGTSLESDAETDVTVTVKLVKTPIEDKTANINVVLTATPVQK